VDKNSLTQQSEIADGQTPNTFALLQNYPNPFNPETIIKYQITSPAAVSLKIYNLRGQEVRTLVDAVQNSGNYEIPWDGRDDFGNEVSSGVYIYRLHAGEQAAVKKLTLIH
jgi:flagellar hook assembly protein FlgD